MQSFFEKIFYTLRLISAFVWVKNYNKYYFDEKAFQSTTFWTNLEEIFFFPYYIIWLELLFLVILYLLEHFKVK
jgi:hypothetical protein